MSLCERVYNLLCINCVELVYGRSAARDLSLIFRHLSIIICCIIFFLISWYFMFILFAFDASRFLSSGAEFSMSLLICLVFIVLVYKSGTNSMFRHQNQFVIHSKQLNRKQQKWFVEIIYLSYNKFKKIKKNLFRISELKEIKKYL